MDSELYRIALEHGYHVSSKSDCGAGPATAANVSFVTDGLRSHFILMHYDMVDHRRSSNLTSHVIFVPFLHFLHSTSLCARMACSRFVQHALTETWTRKKMILLAHLSLYVRKFLILALCAEIWVILMVRFDPFWPFGTLPCHYFTKMVV